MEFNPEIMNDNVVQCAMLGKISHARMLIISILTTIAMHKRFMVIFNSLFFVQFMFFETHSFAI